MEVEKAHIPQAVFGSLKPTEADAEDEEEEENE